MAELLDACMADGAHGLSSGLFYEEAFAAPAEEVTALARVVARHGGVYATHLRSEMAAIIEAHARGRRLAPSSAGVPLVISHHKCAGPANWGRTRETLPLIEALAQRQDIAMDVYPYVAGSTVLREDLVDGVIDVLLTWSRPASRGDGPHAGRHRRASGASTRRKPAAACSPAAPAISRCTRTTCERVIAHPRTMIGCDGLPHDRHPHPRLWGAFPRVLARYWRERELFTLEQAVHKMTGMTARNLRIAERGLLRAGAMADVVVFDPAAPSPTPPPTTSRMSASVGIAQVFVNGACAFRGGEEEPAVRVRAGRMLSRAA